MTTAAPAPANPLAAPRRTPTLAVWQDELGRMIQSIDEYVSSANHPAVRHLLKRYEVHLSVGIENGFITEKEAARL